MARSHLEQFLDALRALPPHVSVRVHWRVVAPWLHTAGRTSKYLVAEASECGRIATCDDQHWRFKAVRQP
jgi:hypothetical protein